MVRWIAPRMGLVAALAAAMAVAAQAQTNIDQGKSSAEIFATDCATCHKSTRGLAAGKNSLTLTGFLREHYTASSAQAAALAAYVLGAGGNEAPARAKKPEPARATATGEEPKREEPKTAARPAPAAAKPEPEQAKPEAQPATASREPKPEEAAPAPNPAPTVATPAISPAPTPVSPEKTEAAAPDELPEVGPTKSAAVPAELQPVDNAPVPRDHIPD